LFSKIIVNNCISFDIVILICDLAKWQEARIISSNGRGMGVIFDQEAAFFTPSFEMVEMRATGRGRMSSL
jgi:hypothetical protein